MKKIKGISLRSILPWLVLLAAYVLCVGTFALYGSHNLDADMSSEMVLADLLNEEGKLMTENWYYSSELRVISPVPAYQLGLLLFDSWHYARTFGMALMQAGVIAAFIFMMRKAGYTMETSVFASSLFCLPFSKVHAFIFAHGAFYTGYFMMSCLIVGLVIDKSSRREWLRALGLIVLGFVNGLVGIRMPMQIGVPLLLACMIALYAAGRREVDYKALLHGREFRMFIRNGVMLTAMFGGFLLNEKVLSNVYSFMDQMNRQTHDFGLDAFFRQIGDMMAYFGYRKEVQLVSAYGLTDALSAALVVFMIGALFTLITDREKWLTAEEKMIPVIAACAVAQGLLVNAMTGNDMNRVYGISYYMTGFLLMMASMPILLAKLPCRLPGVRTAALMSLSAVLMFQSVVFVKNNYRASESDYEHFANWAVENGYEACAATFWNANRLIEASDGKLDVYVLQYWEHDSFLKWLQRKSHFEKLPEGKVLVFADLIEHTNVVPCADDARMVYDETGGRAYHYDSMQEVMDIQTEFRRDLLYRLSLEQN